MFLWCCHKWLNYDRKYLHCKFEEFFNLRKTSFILRCTLHLLSACCLWFKLFPFKLWLVVWCVMRFICSRRYQLRNICEYECAHFTTIWDKAYFRAKTCITKALKCSVCFNEKYQWISPSLFKRGSMVTIWNATWRAQQKIRWDTVWSSWVWCVSPKAAVHL